MRSVYSFLVYETSRDDVVGGTEVGSVVVVDFVVGGLLSHGWFVLVAGAKIAVLLLGLERGPGCAGAERLTIMRFLCVFLGI